MQIIQIILVITVDFIYSTQDQNLMWFLGILRFADIQ